MRQNLVRALVMAISAVGAGRAMAADIPLGPQNFASGTNADDGGTRANFDVTTPASLAAGTYTLSAFSFEASQAGDALPVLATVAGTAGGGSETYTLIAVGSDITAPTTGTFPGRFDSTQSASFILNAQTTVYAGFVNVTGPNPVTWTGANAIGVTPGNDAHFNPGHDLATGNNPVLVGDMFIEAGGAGVGSTTSAAAYELGRVYEFSETVSTPEPATVGMIGFAAMAVLARRRRRA